jgi:glycosyltransferase involved in cell wall biosynthesis
MPVVSVLMPCYNAQQTLGEALDSLLRQTLGDIEIIAVDDGSTDATAEILHKAAGADARLRLFHIPHQGIVSALNSGLAACTAAYVARMDSDDLAHPERLERQAAYLDSHPETGVVSCRVSGYLGEEGHAGFGIYLEWINSLQSDADIRREIFVESPLPHPSVMVRRRLVEEVGGYQDHGWAEDYDLWLRMYLRGVHFARLDETLLAWRDTPTRLTRTDPRYSLENFLRLKAHYLLLGPLPGRDAVLIWGAGMTGRRLSKHLLRSGAPVVAFIDIDPRKIGRTLRGITILSPEELQNVWMQYKNPVIICAVGARGARPLIRQKLQQLEFQEAADWWFVA